eukprot:m.1443194 g.1443194  ORF g.1443194 m.1443194 type:complete len:2355 (-) comp25099_c0_seq2:312-7376(-)
MADAWRTKPSMTGDHYSEIQKKTFTKWFNSHLKHAVSPDVVQDLYVDLRDGLKFFTLFSVIQPEDTISPPSKKPRMKLQRVENINRIIKFLRDKDIRVENIGGEDIEAGQPMLTLGLIWTIILRLQIADIEGADAKNAKAALLAWCKMKTKGYANVNVTNFKSSWQDGLAFNALIHAHRRDLIDMNKMSPSDPIGNLSNAFNVAQDKLGIDALLDAEDVAEYPDEKSIMTQLYSYYQYFTSVSEGDLAGQRLDKFLQFQLNIAKEQELFEADASKLLAWIRAKVQDFQNKNFPNNVNEVKHLLEAFKKEYQQVEKPPRITDKCDLETALFRIQTQLRAASRPGYRPVHALSLVYDEWKMLEDAETAYAESLRETLMRLEKLDKMAKRFLKKAEMRDSWLEDTNRLLSNDDFGADVAAVEASRKREDAIATEVRAYTERLQSVLVLGGVLVDQDYYGKQAIVDRTHDIQRKWEWTKDRLQTRGVGLARALALKKAMKDADEGMEWIQRSAATMAIDNFGRNADEVENLLKATRVEEGRKDVFQETLRQQMAQHVKALRSQQHPQLPEVEASSAGVDAAFQALNAATAKRIDLLNGALAFRKFEETVKEEDVWIRERLLLVASTDVGATVTDTTGLLSKHAAVQAEIVSHQKAAIEPLAARGRDLLAANNPHSDKIKVYVEWLAQLWRTLQTCHTARQGALDNALVYQRFKADCTDADSWLGDKESTLGRAEFGKDSFGSQSLLREHQALQHEVESYAKAIDVLREQSGSVKTLVLQKPPTSVLPDVGGARRSSRLSSSGGDVTTPTAGDPGPETVRARAEFKARRDRELSVAKGEVLAVVSMKDAKWWKLRRTSGEPAEGYVPASFVKLVKRRASEESVATAAASVFPDTPTSAQPSDGRSSVESPAPAMADLAAEARAQQVALDKRYQTVVELCQTRTARLNETIAYHEFCFEAADQEAWITEKIRSVQAAEVGRDAEQVEMFSKKFDLFRSEVDANSSRVQKINDLAGTLVQQNHSEANSIRERQDTVNRLWTELQGLLNAHTDNLTTAGQIANFNQTVEETCSWMQTKVATMSSDLGRDVASVEYLQRLHQTFTSDLTAIGDKMRTIREQTDGLTTSYPTESTNLATVRDNAVHVWDALTAAAAERETQLAQSHDLQMFLAESRDGVAWAVAMERNLHTVEKPDSVFAADNCVQRVAAMRAEIVQPARVEAHAAHVSTGEQLIANGHYAKDDIAARLALGAEHEATVDALSQQLHVDFKQLRDVRAWEQEYGMLTGWLTRQEAFLENTDVGDSVEAVESLIKRHTDFANGVDSYESKFGAQDEFADKILQFGRTTDVDDIAAHRDELQRRLQSVRAASAERGTKLHESLTLQKFLRNCEMAQLWMLDQYTQASDPTYNEPNMLKSEIPRHEVFMHSLADFQSEVDALRSEAEAIPETYFGKETFISRLVKLDGAWENILELARDKQRKLRESLQEHDFKHVVADVELFCADMAAYLKATEVGGDVSAAHDLLERCQQREAELDGKRSTVDDVVRLADELCDAEHFRADEIRASKTATVATYEGLLEPMRARKQQLRESHEYHVLVRASEEALGWMREQVEVVKSRACGADLPNAQRLQNEHRVLNGEIMGYGDKLRTEEISTAQQLIDNQHHAAADIADIITRLQTVYQELKGESEQRLQFLKDMTETSRFFVDLHDSEDVIEGKRQQIQSQDLGGDASSTENAMTEHETTSTQVGGQGVVVSKLQQECQRLIAGRHRDCETASLEEACARLTTAFAELEALVETHRAALTERLQWHTYNKAVSEALGWIANQTETASSTDIGTDQEQCEALLETFNVFKVAVAGAQAKRFDDFVELGNAHITAGHKHADGIQTLLRELQAGWQGLAQAIADRTTLLENANEIHTYYQDCEVTLNRIAEKSIIAGRQDYGDDTAAVDGLLVEHRGFESDLEAIGKKVSVLEAEFTRLSAAYPTKSTALTEKQTGVQQGWDQLQNLTTTRREKLVQSQMYQRFLVKHSRTFDWINDMIKTITDQTPSDELDRAEELLHEHRKLKAEMNARQSDLDGITADAATLCEQYADLAADVRGRCTALDDHAHRMESSWEDWDKVLRESLESLVFERDSVKAATLLKLTREQLDAVAVDPGAVLGVEEIEAMLTSISALERAVQVNDSQFQLLQQLTEAERVELEASGGAEAVARYNESVEQAQLRRIAEAADAEAKQQQAEAERAHDRAEAEAQRQREEAERARKRKEQIAARAESRKRQLEEKRIRALEIEALSQRQSGDALVLAQTKARDANERRTSYRKDSDAKAVRAAAKIAAAKKMARARGSMAFAKSPRQERKPQQKPPTHA